MVAKRTPRGIRNNNPGNLRKSKDKWQGLAAKQTDKEFFQFVTPHYGIRALGKVLVTYYTKYKLNTVEKIITRWAPPSENNTKAYIYKVAKDINVHPAEYISLTDNALAALVVAIIKVENGNNPYEEVEIRSALDGLISTESVRGQKPLSKSRTMKGAAISSTGVATGVLADVSDQLQTFVPAIDTVSNVLPWLAAILTLGGLGLIVYARWDDYKRNKR